MPVEICDSPRGAAHPDGGGPTDMERLIDILRRYGTEMVRVPKR